MTKMFISYRRQDSEVMAGRIYDRLLRHLDQTQVFKDVDSIRGGQEFPTVLAKALEECDIVLVLIGEQWLNIANDRGGARRLDDPSDFVRQEIEIALRRNIRIIPVLIGQATMPTANDLPTTLRKLASRHALRVSHDPDFHHDMTRLLGDLGIENTRQLEQKDSRIQEEKDWEEVQNRPSIALLESFITRYPYGRCGVDARHQLALLLRERLLQSPRNQRLRGDYIALGDPACRACDFRRALITLFCKWLFILVLGGAAFFSLGYYSFSGFSGTYTDDQRALAESGRRHIGNSVSPHIAAGTGLAINTFGLWGLLPMICVFFCQTKPVN
jgi:hypothetical protein